MTEAPDAHEGMTHMLFVDAVIGVGFPHPAVARQAVADEMATFTGDQHNESWVWNRTVLEALPISDLQDLYCSLKTYEVTHADKH